MWCIVKTEFKLDTDSCVSFAMDEESGKRCMFCQNYNILSYVCTTKMHTVSTQYVCHDFKSNLERNTETYDTQDFVGIMVGGCTKHEHGTDLYRRIKEWLEAIKADDSKKKGVRVIFTKNDYPTALFWRSFLEKVYHLYDEKWVKNKMCFRGLTQKMIDEALFVKNIILIEREK
jgi:hypothetical protein